MYLYVLSMYCVLLVLLRLCHLCSLFSDSVHVAIRNVHTT